MELRGFSHEEVGAGQAKALFPPVTISENLHKPLAAVEVKP